MRILAALLVLGVHFLIIALNIVGRVVIPLGAWCGGVSYGWRRIGAISMSPR